MARIGSRLAQKIRRAVDAGILRDYREPVSARPGPGFPAPAKHCAGRGVGFGTAGIHAGLGRLFSADYTDGTLEQMLDHPTASSADRGRKDSGAMLVDGNSAGADLASSGLQFGLSPNEMRLLAVSLLTGIPVLNLIGAMGSALTIGIRGGGLVVSLIVLPLCVPVLVFGAAGNVPLVGAVLALTLVFAPRAAASALTVALE